MHPGDIAYAMRNSSRGQPVPPRIVPVVGGAIRHYLVLLICILTACGRDAPPDKSDQRQAGEPPEQAGDLSAAHPTPPVSPAAHSTPHAPPADRLTPSSQLAEVAVPQAISIPLSSGLTVVSANHWEGGDRENVVEISQVTSEGVLYSWSFREERSGEVEERTFERFTRATDIASSPRLNTIFFANPRGREDTPGYTTFTISRATYARLQEERQAPYTIVDIGENPLGGMLGGTIGGALDGLTGGMVGGLLTMRVTLKGTLTLASREAEPFPVLLNGKRVHLPAAQMRGNFTSGNTESQFDLWVLADSTHPLILRMHSGDAIFQTVRINGLLDLPAESMVEHQLEHSCRAELPGLYFAFASAALEAASAPALDSIATLLRNHPDWALTIEGHTDSIGVAASNQALSLARSEAVRDALLQRAEIEPSRLKATGFGATRPLESNGTLEGRARNRRVELVRACPDPGPMRN